MDGPRDTWLGSAEPVISPGLGAAVLRRAIHVLAALAWVFTSVATWQVWGWLPGLVVFVGTLVVALIMSGYDGSEEKKHV